MSKLQVTIKQMCKDDVQAVAKVNKKVTLMKHTAHNLGYRQLSYPIIYANSHIPYFASLHTGYIENITLKH